MAHPTLTQHAQGRVWHLEDTVRTKVAAEALTTHLRDTEDKKARYNKVKGGYRVWWAR